MTYLGGGRRRRSGYGRRRRDRAHFIGPFPSYWTRTRRGARFTVSGCCLPIPLMLCLSAALWARAVIRR